MEKNSLSSFAVRKPEPEHYLQSWKWRRYRYARRTLQSWKESRRKSSPSITPVTDLAKASSESGCYEAISVVYEHLVDTLNRDPGKVIAWGRSLGTGPTTYLAENNWVA